MNNNYDYSKRSTKIPKIDRIKRQIRDEINISETEINNFLLKYDEKIHEYLYEFEKKKTEIFDKIDSVESDVEYYKERVKEIDTISIPEIIREIDNTKYLYKKDAKEYKDCLLENLNNILDNYFSMDDSIIQKAKNDVIELRVADDIEKRSEMMTSEENTNKMQDISRMNVDENASITYFNRNIVNFTSDKEEILLFKLEMMRANYRDKSKINNDLGAFYIKVLLRLHNFTADLYFTTGLIDEDRYGVVCISDGIVNLSGSTFNINTYIDKKKEFIYFTLSNVEIEDLNIVKVVTVGVNCILSGKVIFSNHIMDILQIKDYDYINTITIKENDTSYGPINRYENKSFALSDSDKFGSCSLYRIHTIESDVEQIEEKGETLTKYLNPQFLLRNERVYIYEEGYYLLPININENECLLNILTKYTTPLLIDIDTNVDVIEVTYTTSVFGSWKYDNTLKRLTLNLVNNAANTKNTNDFVIVGKVANKVVALYCFNYSIDDASNSFSITNLQGYLRIPNSRFLIEKYLKTPASFGYLMKNPDFDSQKIIKNPPDSPIEIEIPNLEAPIYGNIKQRIKFNVLTNADKITYSSSNTTFLSVESNSVSTLSNGEKIYTASVINDYGFSNYKSSANLIITATKAGAPNTTFTIPITMRERMHDVYDYTYYKTPHIIRKTDTTGELLLRSLNKLNLYPNIVYKCFGYIIIDTQYFPITNLKLYDREIKSKFYIDIPKPTGAYIPIALNPLRSKYRVYLPKTSDALDEEILELEISSIKTNNFFYYDDLAQYITVTSSNTDSFTIEFIDNKIKITPITVGDGNMTIVCNIPDVGTTTWVFPVEVKTFEDKKIYGDDHDLTKENFSFNQNESLRGGVELLFDRNYELDWHSIQANNFGYNNATIITNAPMINPSEDINTTDAEKIKRRNSTKTFFGVSISGSRRIDYLEALDSTEYPTKNAAFGSAGSTLLGTTVTTMLTSSVNVNSDSKMNPINILNQWAGRKMQGYDITIIVPNELKEDENDHPDFKNLLEIKANDLNLSHDFDNINLYN